ncbi:MAG: acetate/propionate family kinase [Thermogutta sp.]|uniref:acetate/propionate family kinase n=1 Tax=Thermogutta sp. TaxID=1962930 RepID=UPI0019CE0722|nr:acetate/propionate family kinase [Thermogutta sp.]MBC7352344.1 acetate/propionate family kinase [Thermogutta sp.]
MHILVANIGSTSFKYRLFDMQSETQIARGGVERIGAPESRCFVEIKGQRYELTAHVPDHAAAVRQCLAQLTDPQTGCLKDAREVAAIGFKAVHGGRISGVQLVTEEVLAAMEEMVPVAPAHNPPYIRAMRILRENLPEIPLVAAFETDFHSTIPDHNRFYAVPYEWAEWGVRCWGFHGASHRYIATRTAEIFGRNDLRVISCHLGGSSSVCAISGGKSVFTSMGMSPQSGLPNNNRVGDFDPFALPVIMKHTGQSLEEILNVLATQSGLLGLSGVSTDLRDIMAAAAEGNQRARLAVDVFVAAIRKYVGASLVELGGADVLVFTGGIGENQPEIRSAVCRNLSELGIVIDEEKNQTARGECEISSPAGRVRIWIIPTNEELVVARQTKALLESL